MTKRKIIRIMVLAAFILISAALTILAYKAYRTYGTDGLRDYVTSLGGWGVAVMLLLQIAQVVFAIIPGEPIELVMGAMYGTFGGVLLCLAGTLIGSLLIFLIVRFFGKDLIETFADSDKFEKLNFLKKPATRDVLVFLLMFIPGTPKDLITYFAPFSGIGLIKFLVISTVARIPSVITSTYVGSTFAGGSYLKSAVAFTVVGAVSLAGIYIYNKIVERKNAPETESDTEKQHRQN